MGMKLQVTDIGMRRCLDRVLLNLVKTLREQRPVRKLQWAKKFMVFEHQAIPLGGARSRRWIAIGCRMQV